jgi:hypothetical protein
MHKSLLVILIAIGAWFLISEAATEGWYSWHERKAAMSPEWRVTWPDNPASAWTVVNFQESPVADTVQELLKFDKMRAARWFDPIGRATWNANIIEWEPNKKFNGVIAVHNPTICLPGAGSSLVQDIGTREFDVNGMKIPFRCYEFDSGGRRFFVFSTTKQKFNLSQAGYAGGGLSGRNARLESFENGNRQGPQVVAHFYLTGPRGFESAEKAFRDGIGKFINKG